MRCSGFCPEDRRGQAIHNTVTPIRAELEQVAIGGGGLGGMGGSYAIHGREGAQGNRAKVLSAAWQHREGWRQRKGKAVAVCNVMKQLRVLAWNKGKLRQKVSNARRVHL